MRRKILFITTDQQRHDSLGCNGGEIARTPVVDALAVDGINFKRAYNQNTVCMPARSTILTGQYVRTHGVIANGVPLPEDAPSIAAHLNEHGYRTALLGKAHFEPGFDLQRIWPENFMSERGLVGPYRGFEHAELAVHVPAVGTHALQHYGRWLVDKHGIDATKGFSPLLAATPGGATGAPETRINPIPRDWYHTDWVADRTIAYLDSLPDDADWFVWMSFPDPHHPWDPPAAEIHRCDWRELDLPPGHPGSNENIERVLAQKPAHWSATWDGSFVNAEGGPGSYRPQNVSHDNIREINAMTHIMNELIDEACGRVLARVDQRGWGDDTDVFFTTDHGELQGDYGLLFKGPFHTDALMRLPMVWRPAPSAGVGGGIEISEPVGQLDLAPTFCEIAGVPQPEWVQGEPLPTTPGSDRQRVLCEWDSQFPGYGMHLRSIYSNGWLCTAYEPSTIGQPNGLEEWFAETGMFGGVGPRSAVAYNGTEGELYNVEDDPHQWENRWDDPACKALRADLVADLYDALPTERKVLKVERPA